MTPDQADEDYGLVVYSSDKFIVRVREEATNITATVHRVRDGREQLPRGYSLGRNRLEFD